MSLIPDTCIEYNDKRSICTAKEKGKVYVLENEAGCLVKKVKIDGCAITAGAGTKKCDYLFSASKDNKEQVFLVELKGSDTVQAIRQIGDSMRILSAELNKCRIMARVVGSKRFPEVERTVAYRRLAAKILSTGGNIKIATNKFYKDII